MIPIREVAPEEVEPGEAAPEEGAVACQRCSSLDLTHHHRRNLARSPVCKAVEAEDRHRYQNRVSRQDEATTAEAG